MLLLESGHIRMFQGVLLPKLIWKMKKLGNYEIISSSHLMVLLEQCLYRRIEVK